MAISSSLGYVRIWHTSNWQEWATWQGSLNTVDQAVFSPDGYCLATSGNNPEDALKLWGADTRQELLTLPGTGHEAHLTAFSPDSSTIGVMTGDGFLDLWHAPTMAEIRAAEEPRTK